MMRSILRRLTEIGLLVAAQVLVCNHFHLLGYATPMIYVMLLAYIPLNANRTGTLCWAFALGLIIDFFSLTPGMASASLTLAAFVSHPLLNALAPKERPEDFTPSFRTLGRWKHTLYLLTLTCVHHTAFVALEYMDYRSPVDALLTLGGSVALSMVVMLTLESLRDRPRKSQGNDL